MTAFDTCERAKRAIERIRERLPDADPLRHLPDVHPESIPRHIAIIMDGNGRWAEQRGFPREFGHRNGAQSVRRVVSQAGRCGVECVTLYSFSTENWRRPEGEIDALMQLCETYCEGERDELVRNGIRVRVIGSREGLPASVLEGLDGLVAATNTADAAGPTLCLAVNYGSREEITEAVRRIARRAVDGALHPDDIEPRDVDAALYTAGLPDPDLLIRSAGEMRLSNYLLWQISYAELHVTSTLWPDFDEESLHAAIRDFAARRRRFGGLDSEYPPRAT
ncbi:MAG: polyprenyl diphosphate synthase [Planctomycetota bacterium]